MENSSGHGSLLRTEQIWSRHLGEIILLIAPEFRGKGLGSILANEIFDKAHEIGLMKVVARMASEQKVQLLFLRNSVSKPKRFWVIT
jgi:GNAT superfamily N-acetyltransferase